MVALAVAVAAVAAFLWPGFLIKKTFDADAVASGVRGILTTASPDGYGIDDVSNVACPTDRSIVRDTTFDCTVDIAGESKIVTIVVTGDEKNEAEKGNYTVGLPH